VGSFAWKKGVKGGKKRGFDSRKKGGFPVRDQRKKGSPGRFEGRKGVRGRKGNAEGNAETGVPGLEKFGGGGKKSAGPRRGRRLI